MIFRSSFSASVNLSDDSSTFSNGPMMRETGVRISCATTVKKLSFERYISFSLFADTRSSSLMWFRSIFAIISLTNKAISASPNNTYIAFIMGVAYHAGFTSMRSDTPSSFHTPSASAALTRRVYFPGGILE